MAIPKRPSAAAFPTAPKTPAAPAPVAEQTVEHMGRGEAAVTPYKDACKWCLYRSVCRFDRQQKGCYERDAGKMTIAELLEIAERLK